MYSVYSKFYYYVHGLTVRFIIMYSVFSNYYYYVQGVQ